MKNLFSRFPTRKGEAGMHAVYAVSFTVIAVVALVTLILVNSRADDSNQTAQINNVGPSLGTLTTASSSGGNDISTFTLTEATTTNLFVRGTATDTNGYGDIDTASYYTMKTYRTDVSGGSSCTADGLNCYSHTGSSGVTLSNCSSGTTCDFEISQPIQYYANATDASSNPDHAATNWTARVTVVDDSSASANATDTFEVATTTALNVTASVDYGTIALGGDSAEQTISVTNSGNMVNDYTVSAPNMSCSQQGTIATGNTHYSLTTGFTYGTGDTAMTTSAVAVDANTAIASDSGASATPLYTVLRVPSTGVKGACTNAITFTATTN